MGLSAGLTTQDPAVRRVSAVLRVAFAACLAVVFVGAAVAASPTQLGFTVFARTSLPLGDVVWTGEQFVYVAERTGELDASGPDGKHVTKLAKLPAEFEEVRCAISPGAHGWPAHELFCHGPHGEIWQIGADGSVLRFATLPATGLQDGALAFDEGGSFGYALLASSGGSAEQGGTVYAVGPNGGISTVGVYPHPGGTDNIALAPARFGSASGDLLLAIDARSKGGRLLAMAPDGSVRLLARFAHGLNPIVVLAAGDTPQGAAQPGFYVSDTVTKNVYLLSAAQITQYAGDVLVGGEKGLARFWVVRPVARGFTATRIHTSLESRSNWNFEGAAYVP